MPTTPTFDPALLAQVAAGLRHQQADALDIEAHSKRRLALVHGGGRRRR